MNLQGPNQWMTDRVDCLITDATKSPFTTLILPYLYMEYPDRKIEWNVWSFDQGLASRVPYESAARTLTQSKQSFSGYTVRQGLAITMEHNFMMTKEGMQNFQNQVTQVVGSIQNTNDLDVHMALINAPSHLSHIREKYYLDDYLNKSLRDYIDAFGFLQKNMNAVDILIEDTKSMITGWGGEDPDFMLCSGKMTYQMTMTPEKTNYYTQGPDGNKLLKSGPDMPFYRGLKIIKSKAFSMEEGSAPRDLLRRRVRVAEMYVGTAGGDWRAGNTTGLKSISLYDESSDNMQKISVQDLINSQGGDPSWDQDANYSWLLIRPNIEHYMLGMIIGKGGLDHLGATLWGQTEMSVFDDGQHGVWGMTYKYHERAIVFNERNMHCIWDVAYDGYCGGKDTHLMQWSRKNEYIDQANDMSTEYSGASVIAIPLGPVADGVGGHVATEISSIPSPIILNDYNAEVNASQVLATSDLFINDIHTFMERQWQKMTEQHAGVVKAAISLIYTELGMSNNHQIVKTATMASACSEATSCKIMYQGTSLWHYGEAGDNRPETQTVTKTGCGHHGADYTGVAMVRNGKRLASVSAPLIQCVNNNK